MATNEAKPAGQLQIFPGQEQAFLAPLSVSKIPLCGKVTTQTLRNMGITNIGVLSKIPLKMLEKTFGKLGTMLWERANGIDTSPIVPYHDPKSASKEITFEKDTTDIDFLRRVLIKLVEELCYELRKSGFCTGCITVKIRYSDFQTFTKQVQIQLSASDGVLTKHGLELFEKLYERRLLIRLIGIRFSKLIRGTQQLNLFDDGVKMAPLYYAMDRIRDKYGTQAICKALTLDLNTRNVSLMQNNIP